MILYWSSKTLGSVKVEYFMSCRKKIQKMPNRISILFFVLYKMLKKHSFIKVMQQLVERNWLDFLEVSNTHIAQGFNFLPTFAAFNSLLLFLYLSC